MAQAPLRSIGQVLNILKAEFPDVTISKIRFLEGEGLVSPERAPSGYRKYSESDIERLRYILRVQRDQYLPLKVIRENLELMDAGKEPPKANDPRPAAGAGESVPDPQPAATHTVQAAPGDQMVGQRGSHPIKLTRRELIKASGVPEAMLIELERQRMVVTRRNSIYYGREALVLCVVARKLQAYGMDTRHLRAIKQVAEREAGMIEQGAQPFLRNDPEAGHTINELAQLVLAAHTALMHVVLEH
ncbi:MerR family transcriptional regulator [Propionibacterium freudenreichii]|uniref:transcriptional regulator FtsR n=1 Tax=Propionibacterium freudenreichii TaxID=1744 RepID=UPI000BC2C77E|nr:MerR family transcriptional regulator [Propionibacterium freudenreichii]MDK9295327.1 MerR family transcriptional regulator [Propionibacterium freudenreichii]MDK9360696.1 MerR family transcriptional regulator [Propionibacterium freudenreichii]MDK9638520.1 MerR family transcriptional regulator [Propionibacterium freudenreichii]MDK9660399.1 MerR family transcriptional regulator [Propionibacterium freudenreichii]WGU91266.1 MerR family transcriptional regulator [Propionibacterium freudenreichii]